MLNIITDEGYMLDKEDSKQYIVHRIHDLVFNLDGKNFIEEIKYPDFWGEHKLESTQYQYIEWITNIIIKVIHNPGCTI